jgi:hypothetical protein
LEIFAVGRLQPENAGKSDARVRRRGNEQIIFLMYCGLVESAKDLVKQSKCALGPYDEATDVTTRCELKEVEATDVDHLHTRQIAERFDNATVLIVDDEGAAALAVTAIAHLSLTRTKLARVGYLYDVAVRTKGLEKCNSLLCLLERFRTISNDKGDLFNLLDAMAASENERRKCRGGKGRNRSKTTLVLIHLDVPSAPGLSGSEHPTTTAHVTERGLVRSC